MYNTPVPPETELPGTLRLLKATAVAALAALLILLTIVMPAEYGIDPTGFGRLTGLQRMGEIKMALAAEAAAEEEALSAAMTAAESPAAPVVQTPPVTVAVPVDVVPAPVVAPQPDVSASTVRSDEMQVALAPGEGTEIKVTLARGKTVEYSWQANGGIANFDVHGDSAALDIDYHNYSRGAEASSSGVLEAAFDGNHGWFWRNRTENPITVTLQTRGEYTDIKHLE